MSTFWQAFIGALGAGGVLVGILAFLGKALLGQLLEKDLARFRSELQIVADERSVVFERLHGQRANIIARTYALVVELTTELKEIVRKVEHQQKFEKVPPDRAEKLTQKLRRYHDQNRIWLPLELAERLDGLLRVSEDAVLEAKLVEPDLYLIENELAPYVGQLEVIAKDLESEFRNVLGTGPQPGSGAT